MLRYDLTSFREVNWCSKISSVSFGFGADRGFRFEVRADLMCAWRSAGGRPIR